MLFTKLFQCLTFSFLISIGSLQAQSNFKEGVLTYQVDTLGRTETEPAHYVVRQMSVYKKDSNIRIEIEQVNRFNSRDTKKHIEIFNNKGVYLYMEVSDSLTADFFNFAMFSSPEDHQKKQAERKILLKDEGYKMIKTIRPIKKLGVKAEVVELADLKTNSTSEAILTQKVELPLSSIFNSLIHLSGTPLKFIDREIGWINQYVATEWKSVKLPDQLFDIEPKYKVMTFDELLEGMSDFK